jgi:hypothetical protein
VKNPIRSDCRTLKVLVAIKKPQESQPYYYVVTPLPGLHGRHGATTAYRFTKTYPIEKDKAEYEVFEDAQGHFQCGCLGFLRYARCKHIAAIRKLQEVFGNPG